VCGAFKDLAQVQYLHHNDICEDEASPRAIRKFERRAFQRLMDRLLKLPRLFPAEEPY